MTVITSSLKRTSPDSELELLPKKRRKLEYDEDTESKIAKIMITAEIEHAVEDAVWMHKKDIKRLYPNHIETLDKNSNFPLVRLVNRIYRVLETNSISPGCILINPCQFKEAKEGVFVYSQNNCILLSPLEKKVHNFPVADLMIIHLTQSDQKEAAFTLEDLRGDYLNCFKNSILTKGQLFTISLLGYQFQAKIEEIQNTEEEEENRFYRLEEQTEIHFSAQESIHICSTVHEITDSQTVRMKLNPANKKQSDQKSIVINYRAALRVIKEQLQEGFIKNQKMDIEIKGKVFNLTIQKVIDPQKKSFEVEQSISTLNYQKLYILQDNSEPNFIFDFSENILFAHEIVPAERVSLKIEKYIKNKFWIPMESKKIQKEEWLCVNELKEALLSTQNRKVVLKQRLIVKLSTGKFFIHIKDCFPAHSGLKVKGMKKIHAYRWLDSETKLDMEVSKKHGIHVVDSYVEHELEKVILKIKQKDSKSGSKINFEKLEKTREFIVREAFENKVKKLLKKPFVKNQKITFDCKNNKKENVSISMKVKEMYFQNTPSNYKYGVIGKITDQTQIEFDTNKEEIALVEKSDNALTNFDLTALETKVGGISDQLKIVTRKIMLSRGKFSELSKKRGLNPIKGILLYGPPGTGKTTFARNIGEVFGCSEGDRFQLINASQLMDKYVGETEKKIRELFQPAEIAQKKGEKDLHIIVIDEAEAILGTRRANTDSPWYNSWINQFLGKIDGLHQLNNILIILMTNRPEIIDPAILRPGRIELHLELALADLKGRKEILEIHTKQLRENDLLQHVELETIAALTEGFSGAELEGIVKNASSYSLERLDNLNVSQEELATHLAGKITMDDFKQAINEISKAFK